MIDTGAAHSSTGILYARAKNGPPLADIRAPEALSELKGWLIWKYVPNGKKKPRKVPYYVSGGARKGAHGGDEDRAKMVDFHRAKMAAIARGFDGVGLALMPEFGITALDFDNCVDESGVNRDVAALVAETYAEYSPSGNGVRAFVYGALGNRKSNGEPFGFETFSTNGFVTFTGDALNDRSIVELTPGLRDYFEQRFGFDDLTETDEPRDSQPVGYTEEQLREALAALPKDLPYEADRGQASWIAVGMALHHETGGSVEGFELWDNWSRESPKYSDQAYGRARWRSFGNNDRQVTAQSLRKWCNEHGAGLPDPRVATDADFDSIVSSDVEPTGVANADEFDQPVEAPKPAKPATQPARPDLYPLFQARDFAHQPLPEWIIKGVLPRAGLVVVYGESGAGKSFVLLDLVAAVARGLDWRGHRTKPGRVVYLCAEGAGGFRGRLRAYEQTHAVDLADLPLHVIGVAPNFLEKADALKLGRTIRELVGATDVLVVDTVAQVTPGGNENSSEDMGRLIHHCAGLHRALGATVLLVHHAGKDASRGARGWSGLRAAADAELEVVRKPAGRLLRVTKQKDGADDGCWGFDLRPIQIGVDEDGDPIDSCVVVEANAPIESDRPSAPKGKWQRLVWETASNQIQGGPIPRRDLIRLCAECAPAEDQQDRRLRDKISQAVNALIGSHLALGGDDEIAIP